MLKGLGKMKIGYGTITCDREDFFRQGAFGPIAENVDSFVVVNDGQSHYADYPAGAHVILHHDRPRQGVAVAKNQALKYLLDRGSDVIFLQEDDVVVSPEILPEYIKAFEVSGIHHFNWPLHGPANKTPSGIPIVKAIVPYKHLEQTIRLTFSPWCIGAFSMYTRESLDAVGLMDETFYNAIEHLEHTYRMCRAGFHPPYHWFADVEGSDKFIREIEFSDASSIIRRDAESFRKACSDSTHMFEQKYGFGIDKIPPVPYTTVEPVLRRMSKGVRTPSDDIPEDASPFIPTVSTSSIMEQALQAALRLSRDVKTDTKQGRKDIETVREASAYFGLTLHP